MRSLDLDDAVRPAAGGAAISIPAAPCAFESAPPDSRIRHGTRCECRVLAAAVGGNADAVPFWYCRKVLQRRWSMTCMHGVIEEPFGKPRVSEKWQRKERLTALDAILVRNL